VDQVRHCRHFPTLGADWIGAGAL